MTYASVHRGLLYEGSAIKPLHPRNRFARLSAHGCSPVCIPGSTPTDV